MTSAILPIYDADTIALDFGVFIAERARTYRASRAAILSAINPLLPSQPIDPAAVTSLAPQPDVQAEGVTSSSATLLPETANALQKAAGATIQSDQPEARPEASPEISGKPEATPSLQPQPTSTPAVRAQAVERAEAAA